MQEFGPGNLCDLCVFEKREEQNPSLRFCETDDQTRVDCCVNTPVQVFIRRGPKNFTDRRTVKRAKKKKKKKGFTAACAGFNQRDKQRVKSQSRRSKHLKGCGSKKRRREKKAPCSTSLNLLELRVLGRLISTEIYGFLQDLGKERGRISYIGGKKFPNTFEI